MSFVFRNWLELTHNRNNANWFEAMATFNADPTLFKVDLINSSSGTDTYDENALATYSYSQITTGALLANGLLRHNLATPQSIGATALITSTVTGSTSANPARQSYNITVDTDVVFPTLGAPTGAGAGYVLRYVMVYYQHPTLGATPWILSDAGDVAGKTYSGDDFTVDVPILLENKCVGTNAT